MNKISLELAEVVIEFRSRFPFEKFSEKEKKDLFTERFKGMIYRGSKSPDIVIDVKVVSQFPSLQNDEVVCVVYHPDDGAENWRMLKKGSSYIYSCPIEGKEQIVVVNQAFNRGTAYLLVHKEKGFVWDVGYFIYDFLQTLLINYLAYHKQGIIIHSIGLKDIDGCGLLFAGKSGAGKTTTARLWRRYSRAKILNDDRVIVRFLKNEFRIYGSPWHGDFSDYLSTCADSARLRDIFFIEHTKKNNMKQLTQAQAFRRIYPSIILIFWDHKLINNIISFCWELIGKKPCWQLGFRKDKAMVEFVREGIRE